MYLVCWGLLYLNTLKSVRHFFEILNLILRGDICYAPSFTAWIFSTYFMARSQSLPHHSRCSIFIIIHLHTRNHNTEWISVSSFNYAVQNFVPSLMVWSEYLRHHSCIDWISAPLLMKWSESLLHARFLSCYKVNHGAIILAIQWISAPSLMLSSESLCYHSCGGVIAPSFLL